MGKGSTLGLLYTGRTGGNYANHVGGADGFFRLSQSDSIRFQYLHSETEYPKAIAQNFGQKQGFSGGDAIQAEFTHLKRNWQFYGMYTNTSANFRADYGFLPRVDVRTFDGQLQRTFWGSGKGWFSRVYFWLRGYHTSDNDGHMTDSRIALGGAYEGPLQSQVTAIGRLDREFYNGVTYDVSDLVFELALKPAGGLNFGFASNLAKAIDYNNSRPAEALRLGPQIELGLGRHVNLNVSHNLEWLTSDGLRTYTANLSQVRLIYNFSVRAFVRAIVQYRDIDRVPERYTYPVDTRTTGLFTQFLFSYKINPQTVLFVGYSDNSMGFKDIDLTRTNRTFFSRSATR